MRHRLSEWEDVIGEYEYLRRSRGSCIRREHYDFTRSVLLGPKYIKKEEHGSAYGLNAMDGMTYRWVERGRKWKVVKKRLGLRS